MENHPIPQDITGFQFKLIGDMTIKQFAYLAAGIVVGWIIFILPLTPIVRIPLAGISILLGASFAFLPIEGRPMDLMISNFVKAIFYPTQFVYQKQGGHLWLPVPHIAQSQKQQRVQKEAETASLSGQALKDYLNSLPKRSKSQLDQKEMVFFESLATMQARNPAPQLQMPQPAVQHPFANNTTQNNQVPEPQEVPEKRQNVETHTKTEEILARETMLLQQQLAEAKALEAAKSDSTGYQQAHQKVLELEKTLSDTSMQKLVLERQIQELQKRLSTEKKEIYTPSIAQAPKAETQNVRSIPEGLGKSIGLPISPEFPNLVTGIVKDPRGNPLGNILVEIKDADNNPVRAFKTNPLGQFASATPINNGTYTIEFEDPKGENKFDIIQFSASGQIILPIEVISVDQREELRRSLFN